MDCGRTLDPGLGPSSHDSLDSLEENKRLQPVPKREKKYKFNAYRRWKSKKRKGFMGSKQHKSPKTVDNANDEEEHHLNADLQTNLAALDQTPSSEFKKLKNRSAEKLKRSPLNTLPFVKKKAVRQVKSKPKGFKIQDQQLLANCITKAAICSSCKKPDSRLVLYEEKGKRQGLAEKLFLECSLCQATAELETSSKSKSNLVSEVNLRSVYAAQSYGLAGLRKFCTIMNLPPPVTNKSFYSISKMINKECKKRADANMRSAANRIIDLTKKSCPENVEVTESGAVICNVAVTVDGTWQKRGHSSKIGVVFVIAVETGEILDYELKSLYCHACVANKNKKQSEEEYEIWKSKHELQCCLDHKGSSDSMETDCAVEIFLRSVERYGLRYTTFVGDGDSSCFGVVQEKCLGKFGESYMVKKEECVGHVQKRLGSGLREYKRKKKGLKLSDGKAVGGKGRLTDKICDKMQNYYGQAIRNNSGNKDEMVKAIWAILKHMVRNDSETLDQQHSCCPKSSTTWCKFWQQDGEYCDNKRLPSVFYDELRPLFARLSEDKLLERCLMGLTQNQNEAVNNLLWSKCPKTKFCGRRNVETAVCETICHFNSGVGTKAIVVKELGCDPGENMISGLKKIDEERVKNATSKISEKYRRERRKRRAEKKSNDEVEHKYPNYKAGAFGLFATPDIGFEVLETHTIDGNGLKAKKPKKNEAERKHQRPGVAHACDIVFVDESRVIVFS